MKSQDFAALEEKLYAVSSPGHDEYGQHLSKEEVEELVAPSNEGASAVKEWLNSHGLSPETVSSFGNMLQVNLTIKQANALLDADYATFTDQKTGKQTVRTLSYSVPASVQEHISYVHPTVQFPIYMSGSSQGVAMARRQPSDVTSRDLLASCATSFTPACAQEVYGIPQRSANQTSTQLGLLGVSEQWASEADLQLFLQKYRPDIPASTSFDLTSVSGGINNQSDPGTEGNLVTQYAISLATGIPVNYISVGEDLFAALVDMSNALLNETNPPQVVDISYTLPELFLDEPTASHICQSLAQLGARGITVLVGAGARGVSGGEDEGECHTFVPEFPATCPYVTTVGGTTGVPEVAWNQTGGGFSNFFSIPSYQASELAAYQKAIPSSYDGLYNTSGRGFPDISAMATVADYYLSGELTSPDGMSGATPILASLFALLNDELASARKPPLGFLNPLIYANPDAFTDVTSGDNPSCNSNGFSAATGWDAITGLGSPVYSKLQAAVGLQN